ncbi:hypothetical protein CsSME_00008894 [Camellia sinensis var. sinensis]
MAVPLITKKIVKKRVKQFKRTHPLCLFFKPLFTFVFIIIMLHYFFKPYTSTCVPTFVSTFFFFFFIFILNPSF